MATAAPRNIQAQSVAIQSLESAFRIEKDHAKKGGRSCPSVCLWLIQTASRPLLPLLTFMSADLSGGREDR